MKICLVGEGAFANKHIDAIARIEDVEVSVICGGVAETTEAVANARGIPFYTTDLAEALNQPGVDAGILATPTGLHATQAIQIMRSGKHVLIEIPMADNLADAQKIVEVQGTAEEDPFTTAEFQALMELAQKGVTELVALQRALLGN